MEEIIIKNKKKLNEYKNKNVYKNKEEYQKLFEKIEELNSKIKENYKINIWSENIVGTIYSENYKVKFPPKIEFEQTIDYEKRIFEMLSLIENLVSFNKKYLASNIIDLYSKFLLFTTNLDNKFLICFFGILLTLINLNSFKYFLIFSLKDI